MRSKGLVETGIFERAVGSCFNRYAFIERKMSIGYWAKPYLMITFALPDESAAPSFQQLLYITIVSGHSSRGSELHGAIKNGENGRCTLFRLNGSLFLWRGIASTTCRDHFLAVQLKQLRRRVLDTGDQIHRIVRFKTKAGNIRVCDIPAPGFVVASEMNLQFVNFFWQKFAPLVDASPERTSHLSYQALPHMIAASALSSVPLMR